jgi:hypothetical protein
VLANSTLTPEPKENLGLDAIGEIIEGFAEDMGWKAVEKGAGRVPGYGAYMARAVRVGVAIAKTPLRLLNIWDIGIVTTCVAECMYNKSK